MMLMGDSGQKKHKNENDEEEEDIDARLTRMLGVDNGSKGGGSEKEPLLQDGEAAHNLMKHRMAAPQFSIMKARSLAANNMTM